MNIDRVTIHTANGRKYSLSVPVNGILQRVVKDALLEQLLSESQIIDRPSLLDGSAQIPFNDYAQQDVAKEGILHDRALTTNPRNKKRLITTSNQFKFNKAAVKEIIGSKSKSMHEDDFWQMCLSQGISIKRPTVACYLGTMVMAGVLVKSEVTPKLYRINKDFSNKYN